MAHPLALAYTHIDRVNHNYLHGEMVAMGTMAQLVLEQSPDIRKAATFFARVGLPIHLGQLSLSPDASEDLDALAEVTFESPNSHYMPITLSQELIRESILEAHEVGLAISREIGDEAYRRLHA
jgi:glycerol dehydrogenase